MRRQQMTYETALHIIASRIEMKRRKDQSGLGDATPRLPFGQFRLFPQEKVRRFQIMLEYRRVASHSQ